MSNAKSKLAIFRKWELKYRYLVKNAVYRIVRGTWMVEILLYCQHLRKEMFFYLIMKTSYLADFKLPRWWNSFEVHFMWSKYCQTEKTMIDFVNIGNKLWQISRIFFKISNLHSSVEDDNSRLFFFFSFFLTVPKISVFTCNKIWKSTLDALRCKNLYLISSKAQKTNLIFLELDEENEKDLQREKEKIWLYFSWIFLGTHFSNHFFFFFTFRVRNSTISKFYSTEYFLYCKIIIVWTEICFFFCLIHY